MTKRIQFNRVDKDYSAYYDDELIGTFATYHQAEIELDAHALDLLERGLLDTAEGITTMQWQAERDGGSIQRWREQGEAEQTRINALFARPAEAPELFYAGPADEPPPDGPGENSPGPNDPTGPHVDAARCRACGGQHICAPDGVIRCVTCASKDIEYPDYDALPGAIPESAVTDITPEASIAPAGQAGAPTESTQPADSGLLPLLRASLDEWLALGEQGIATEFDIELAALARRLLPDYAAQEQRRAFGRAIWESYRERRQTLADILRDSDAEKRQEMAEALTLFLNERTRTGLHVALVERHLAKIAAPA